MMRPGRLVNIERRTGLLHACIVHQDVEAAELRCRFRNTPSATGNIRYIHVDHMGKPAKVADGFRAAFKGRGVPGSNCDIGPCPCKALSDSTPDPPAGSGDQRLPSVRAKTDELTWARNSADSAQQVNLRDTDQA